MRDSESIENAVKVQFWCIFVKINWSTKSGKEAIKKLLIVADFIVITKTSQERRNKTLVSS